MTDTDKQKPGRLHVAFKSNGTLEITDPRTEEMIKMDVGALFELTFRVIAQMWQDNREMSEMLHNLTQKQYYNAVMDFAGAIHDN